MPGFANLFYMGQPDPAQQLARMLSGQQPQGAPPPGPGPAGPAGPAPAGPAPAAGPNGAPGAPQDLTPGAPPPPGSPPQPAALTSSPDMSQSYAQLAQPNLMSLYVQMQQRDQAMAGINSAFAQIAANHSPPSMRSAIMQNANAGGGDAGTMVNNLMSLHGAMQQQGAMQDMLNHAPDYDQKLGLPPGTARDEILAGRGPDLIAKIASEAAPTDMAKNYAWARKTYADAHPGASPDDIDQGAQGILLGVGGMGGGDSATRSWRAAKIQWDQNPATKGTPYPWGAGADDNPTSFASWQGAQKVEETKQTEDQQEAAGKLPTYVQNLNGARKKLTDILGVTGVDDQGHPVMDPDREALLKSVIGNPYAQSYVNGEPGVGREWTAWWSQLNSAQKQVLNDIKEATDPNTLIGGIGKRAPKRGAADVNDITSGLSGMHDVTKGYGHWVQGALDTIGSIDTATGNAYGASGQADQAPDNVKDLIDPTYLYGGKLYPKSQHPQQIPADQLASAQQQIKQADNPEDMRQKLITHFRARNFDPTPLKGL